MQVCARHAIKMHLFACGVLASGTLRLSVASARLNVCKICLASVLFFGWRFVSDAGVDQRLDVPRAHP